MPPLLESLPSLNPAMVPIIPRSPSKDSPFGGGKDKAAVRHPPRRQYEGQPPPFQLSAEAPRDAKIMHRNLENHIVAYQLKFGEQEVNVGLDEILDWVSPLDLENFENACFHEQIEVDKILEKEKEDRKMHHLLRMKERAKTKGAVFVDETSDAENDLAEGRSDAAMDVEVDAELAAGRHGRARPSYSQFYKKGSRRGRTIHDDVNTMAEERTSQSDEEAMIISSRPDFVKTTASLQDLPKRRRRKRHPLTGELMPLGWQYDPNAESNAYEMRRAGLGGAVAMAEPEPFTRLSISEQPAKRPRLDNNSTASGSSPQLPNKTEMNGQNSDRANPGTVFQAQSSVIDIDSSDGEPKKPSALKPRPAHRAQPDQQGKNSAKHAVESTATTSNDTSPEPAPSASQHTPKAPSRTTSILSPSMARASSTEPLAQVSEEESESEVDEGEWFIESILGHRLSDPRTHPAQFGKEAVMLYSVKWEGYEKPTWEPIESFGDRTIVDQYRKNQKLPPIPRNNGQSDDEEAPAVVLPTQTTRIETSVIKPTSQLEHDEDEEDEADEYEVEKIMAHHMSDPRTHPTRLGRTPIMLYQVKWKGFEELTWEPEASFQHSDVLKAYKRRKGLDRAGVRDDVGLVGRLLA